MVAEKDTQQRLELDGRPVDSLEPQPDKYAHAIFLNWKLDPAEEVPAWGTAARDTYLRDLAQGVDLIADAIAFITWKVVGQPFVLSGPERTARKWRKKLLGTDYTTKIAQWVRQSCWAGVGGWCKILRYPPRWAVDANGALTARGRQYEADGRAAAWEVAGLEVLDSRRITPTGNPERPIWYSAAAGGEPVLLHRSQVLCIQDSPIADADRPGYGQCGVERCLDNGRLRGYIAAYFREAFSDKPRPGIIILNNIMQADWEAIRQRAEITERQKALKYIGEQIVLTSAEATAPASATEVPFRVAPSGWDQAATYNECKEIVAAAWGLDPLEFGAMPGEGLGSGKQATAMAAKSRGKFLAFVLSSIEREFRRFLPQQLEFAFVSNDPEEKLLLAEQQAAQISNVKEMWTGDTAHTDTIITTAEARQLLIDADILPREFLVAPDSTDQADISDTEAEVTENIVRCYSTGAVVIVRRRTVHRRQPPAGPHTHNPAALQATTAYEAQLRTIYHEWAVAAAGELADTPADEYESKLEALLALLLLRLQTAGRDGLTAAYNLGLDGEEMDVAMRAALAAAIASNDAYLADSFIPAVRERFQTDTAAPEFAWQEAGLLGVLTALEYRTQHYGGAFWAAIAAGVGYRLSRRDDPPVFRYLDPVAQHCGTCPPKEREYANWAEMVTFCGGVPGDGSDECGPGCRCGVDAYINGQWQVLL